MADSRPERKGSLREKKFRMSLKKQGELMFGAHVVVFEK